LDKIEELSKSLVAKVEESLDIKNNEELAKIFKGFLAENKNVAQYLRDNILKRKNTEFDDNFWREKIVLEEDECKENDDEEEEKKGNGEAGIQNKVNKNS
jgi:hypothetical protein